jgi:DNA excision repair protein ERCC-4
MKYHLTQLFRYTQCELMSAHYKQPVLLIEFEEHKSFSLGSVADVKSYTKPTGKYPPRKPGNRNEPVEDGSSFSSAHQNIQSKLVLLLLAFPRVRVLWSSSPYVSADIFVDLKRGEHEPDPTLAIAVGSDDPSAPDASTGAGNAAGEELLRALPGIGGKNVGYVMSKVRNVRELCEMSLEQVQSILGVAPGKLCWEFLHKGE